MGAREGKGVRDMEGKGEEGREKREGEGKNPFRHPNSDFWLRHSS